MSAFFKFPQLQPNENYGELLFTLSHKYYDFGDEVAPFENQPLSNLINTQKSSTCLPTTYVVEEDFQKSFLFEHLFILKKYIKKFRELFPNQLDKTQNSVGQNLPPFQPTPLSDLLRILSEETGKSTERKKEQKEYGILGCQKIVQLLQTLLQDYPREVSLPLLRMSLSVWLEYQRISHRRLVERDIVDYSCKILKPRFMRELELGLLCKDQGQKLKSFALVLVNTLIFVASGYFVNPYYQLQQQLTAREFVDYEIFLYDSSSFNCFLSDENDEEDEEESLPDQEYGSRPRKLVKHESTISDSP